MVATPTFLITVATVGIERTCRSPTLTKTDARCCTLKARDKPPPSTWEKNLQASTQAATMSLYSTLQSCYQSHRRRRMRRLHLQKALRRKLTVFRLRYS